MDALYVMPFIEVMMGAALPTQRAALIALLELTNSPEIIVLAIITIMTAGRALDAHSLLVL